ncbi:MAB_1171c family putative transporter [Actinoplanes sp. TFC3]|uniref:MAB_1171c family putative transporter n=1 Tax=Actinoplanes sp. TFC3 TaxID=1710355 RepID=UPI00082E93BD|nr:MAB_1171c family putative transporter [Actinoplanes sp. TFC3]
MNGPLNQLLLVLLWGTVAIRFPTLWRDAQQRALWATLLLLALVKTVATPAVNEELGELIAHPEKLPHLLGVLVGFFLLRFICLVTDRPRGRGQFILAVAVVVTLVLLRSGEAGYWVVLNGYLGTVLTIAATIFWQASCKAPAGLLRHGLRAIGVGVGVSAVYALVKTSLIVAEALHAPVSFEAVQPQADTVRALGTILAVVGAAVPAGNRLRTVVGAYRALWELRPLWQVMRRTFPEVILFSRRRALLELSGVEEVQLRLYRRVIEIRDGMLTLRAYLPGGALRDASAFLEEEATPELVEACGIALALERHRTGSEASEQAQWTDTGEDSELGTEIAWLSRVSASFRRPEPRRFAQSVLR